ncbi:MAG TPA: carbamoyltransferase C-terminal domain-containing protein [Candidatus Dormibacteraeota bacterium]|nr:carbamoyltransferase C-terminal domain-containing protein [Candidatus Dormibacteraeota bacterium]
MNILGINAYHGNASAAIVCDGKLIAAVEEERFNRVKYAAGFPSQAIRYCLKAAGLTLDEIDHVTVPRNPYARLITKIIYALRMPSFARERAKLLVKFQGIPEALALAFDADPKRIRAKFHRIEHHQAHLASSFYCSPFERAALLSADGLGDFASTMWGAGNGSRMRIDGAIVFPHSLGLFYCAVTQYLGFLKFGDEYKVMGLAAYGEPEQLELFRDMVRFKNGSGRSGFKLGLDYFSHHRTGPEMSWTEADKTPRLGKLFSEGMERRLGPARTADQALEQRHRNIAASLQTRLEEVYLGMLRKLAKRTGLKAVCLAGGVAFNCVANGKIFDATPFEQVYVQPAAGDGGLSVGAAFYLWHQILGKPRSFVMDHVYWGPKYSWEDICRAVESSGLAQKGCAIAEFREEELARRAAAMIADGKILGWFQGRAEWGPRALGNRSIVADARCPEMKEILNRRIKHREIFRPFAPSILAEATAEYFEKSHPSPFMTLAYAVRPEKRGKIDAPTHVDGTGRLQTVTREANPRYHALISAFRDLTGVPVVLNTSFNDNEPIVCRPEEAINCFQRTQMDALVLGDLLITRPSVP